MKILIVYFSRGGTAEAVAQAIHTQLSASARLIVARIEPIRLRGYWGWLLRSFVPRSRVPIHPTVTNLTTYELICLGFPKWTYACPPVNQYLQERESCEGKNFALFMCHRGFDQERYLESMVRQVSQRGGQVVATLAAQQKTVEDGSYGESLTHFCDRIQSHLKKTGTV